MSDGIVPDADVARANEATALADAARETQLGLGAKLEQSLDRVADHILDPKTPSPAWGPDVAGAAYDMDELLCDLDYRMRALEKNGYMSVELRFVSGDHTLRVVVERASRFIVSDEKAGVSTMVYKPASMVMLLCMFRQACQPK